MSSFLIGFIVGAVVGACVSVIVLALCAAAARGDVHLRALGVDEAPVK